MMKLTELVHGGGCAAKLDPSLLRNVLGKLPKMESGRLVEGFEGSDDALVWRIDDSLVMIETVDFFPPMVDDPFLFGQIAAANALSDMYAMGAEPSVAMNLLCYPTCGDMDGMLSILKGGQDKVAESGAVIAGGHTISDAVPKYGLCVTGFSKPDEVWSNGGAREGDVLVLTKNLGVGIAMTALKADMCGEKTRDEAIGSMRTLNKGARDAARKLKVHAATDVTGFGLAGHAMQMADASGKTFLFHVPLLPILSGARELSLLGLNPEGLYRNQDYVARSTFYASSVSQVERDLTVCPETSGGLLLSLPSTDAEKLCSLLPSAHVVGSVEKRGSSSLLFLSK